MKELSIEEKAKRHDEAIERAKTLYDNSQPLSGCNVIIETLFSEFKESMDEKIRKRLLEYFKSFTSETFFNGVPTNDAITWLEKQVEPKSIEPDTLIEEAYQQQADDIINMVTEKSSWSEEDEDMHYKVIAVINRLCAEGKEYVWSIKTLKKLFYWLKSLKERVQPHNIWKPSDEQMGALWDSIKHNLHLHPVLESLYNELKKLREE